MKCVYSSNELFHISHDCVTENTRHKEITDKICLKSIRDFFQYVVCDQGRDREIQFFGGGDIQ